MYYYTTIAIAGREATRPYHRLTDDEAAILGQLIELDGFDDMVILAREDIRNSSGRRVGEHLTIAEDAWEVVREQVTSATS